MPSDCFVHFLNAQTLRRSIWKQDAVDFLERILPRPAHDHLLAVLLPFDDRPRTYAQLSPDRRRNRNLSPCRYLRPRRWKYARSSAAFSSGFSRRSDAGGQRAAGPLPYIVAAAGEGVPAITAAHSRFDGDILLIWGKPMEGLGDAKAHGAALRGGERRRVGYLGHHAAEDGRVLPSRLARRITNGRYRTTATQAARARKKKTSGARILLRRRS